MRKEKGGITCLIYHNLCAEFQERADSVRKAKGGVTWLLVAGFQGSDSVRKAKGA